MLELKLIDIRAFDPSPGPRGLGQQKIAVVRPINWSNSHTKFG